jgi:hypothetical protein
MTTPTGSSRGRSAKASDKPAPKKTGAKASGGPATKTMSGRRAGTRAANAKAAATKASGAKAAAGKATDAKSAGATTAADKPSRGAAHDGHGHDLTITIPVDQVASVAAKAVSVPVTAAQRVLPAKGGLPLYLGLGALGVAGILEWPVAAGIGVGYAVLRRGGALAPRPADAKD